MIAEYVIDQFAVKDDSGEVIQAGVPRLAEALGLHVTTVYNWLKPIAKRGTGGVVPTKQQHRVKEAASVNDIYLDPMKLYDISTCS